MKTKQNGKIEIEKLTAFSLTDEEYDFCFEESSKLYRNNPQLYAKATSVITQLGLHGFWRGISAAIVIVANAISKSGKEASKDTWVCNSCGFEAPGQEFLDSGSCPKCKK